MNEEVSDRWILWMISLSRFDKKEVPNDVLQRVVEKINLCPTAGNKQVRNAIWVSCFQSYFVYVVKSPELIKAAGKATGQGWVESVRFGLLCYLQVPCLLVFCCECKDSYYGKRGLELFALQDASIAQTFAILALQEEGLSNCFFLL